MDCLFCNIIARQVPAKILYEDDDILVFPDIHPVRPVHLIIIPKVHVTELLTVEDSILFQKLFLVVQNMIKREGLHDKGYRISINGGGAQLIQHLHIHLTGPILKTDPIVSK